MLVDVDSVSSVRLRLGQFSQSSFMQHVGLCVFSLLISLMMIVRIPYLILLSSSNRKYDPFTIVYG